MVFLAGLPATTHFWQGAFDPLAKTHRLILVDTLGFGRSPLPAVDYTLEDHLGALRRTLVTEGATRRVTIVAHSFGTVLAAYYAARYPDEVDRLFLLEIQDLAKKTGAQVLTTDDDHLSYPSRSAGRITAAMEARGHMD